MPCACCPLPWLPQGGGSQDPFFFLNTGKSDCISTYLGTGGKLTAGNSIDILDVSDSGTVKVISLVLGVENLTSAQSLAAMHGLSLQITYDGAVLPQVDVPLFALLSLDYYGGFVNKVVDAEFFSIGAYGSFATWWAMQAALRYPIPYTNGVKVTIKNNSAVDIGVWSNVEFQETLASNWNSNYRFLVSRIDQAIVAPVAGAGTIQIAGTHVIGAGTAFNAAMIGKTIQADGADIKDAEIVSVQDANNLTIADADAKTVAAGATYNIGNYATFINRPAGAKGFIASVYGGVKTIFYAEWEALTRFYVNGEISPSYRASGTEDFFENCFLWAILTPALRSAGVVNIELSGAPGSQPETYCVYKMFRDRPIFYSDGIIGKEAATQLFSNQDYRWSVVYYEEQ